MSTEHNTPTFVKPARRTLATAEQFEGNTLMRLRCENVKCIRLMDVSIDQTMTVIGGDNAAGKTSFLDSLEWLLAGKAVIQADPIHKGERTASIVADFGDGQRVKLTATRNLKRVGDDEWTTDIDVEIPGHITPSKVQDFLSKLAGEFSFDPMAFDALKPEEQFESLRKFVVGFDFKDNAARRKRAFDARTDVNRDQKRTQSAADAIVVSPVAPTEFIDESALTSELKQAGEHNTKLEQRRANRAAAVSKIENLRQLAQSTLAETDNAVQIEVSRSEARIADWRAQIKALNAKIADEQSGHADDVKNIRAVFAHRAKESDDEADALQAKLDAAEELPKEKDAAAIEARLATARQTNKLLADWNSRRDLRLAYQNEADKLSSEADELTSDIVELDAAKEDAIRKAHLPIDGLGFGDGFITLNNVPWNQSSMAERIDASTAIAMALNPKLKVILIRDGSNLGSKIKERITARAAEKGFRVLMEVVDESGANSHVFIEDGMVRAVKSETVAA